jgi:hypothetical protein
MEELLASLRALSARYADSPGDDARELSWELDVLIQEAPSPAYQYRNHPRWDTTWMDLDESQVGVVLEHGHSVERRLILGDWEAVTEVPA